MLYTVSSDMSQTIYNQAYERVQALADISRSPLCCHISETRAPIANPPNSAQLGENSLPLPKLHPGPCSAVVRECGEGQTDTQTDTQTHRRYTFRVIYDSREMYFVKTS